MSEEKRRWRCPYCDGLNDWQNVVCEICGDGRREEAVTAEMAASAAEKREAYTPPKSEAERDTPKRKPEREAPRSTYTPPAPEPPRKKKKGGVWVVIVIVALAAFGGRFLADRFVASVEKDKADEFAVPISTPAATKTPEKTQAKVPQPTEKLVKSTQPVAAVVIDTVTDNQNGTATLKLKINEPRDEYWIFWYCEGTDRNEKSFIPYSIQPGKRVMPRDEKVLKPPEDTITLPVVPGCYTRFIIEGISNFSLKEEDIWLSEPYYFKENTNKQPVVITDAHLLKWSSSDAWKATTDARNAGDVSAVHRVASEYSPTTAQALNELLRKWVEHESQEFLGYEIHTERVNDPYVRYALGEPHPFVEYLSGPGVHVMNIGNTGFNAIAGDQFTFLNVFHDEYRLLEQFGGYPPGDYTIDLFYCGVRMYTMHFTLN